LNFHISMVHPLFILSNWRIPAKAETDLSIGHSAWLVDSRTSG
jgi:hypothetical protein